MLNSIPEVYLSRLPYIEDLLMEALGLLPTRAEVARFRSETLLSMEGPVTWVEGNNVTRELLELVKRGDEVGFRALAGCVMPADEVDECWHGAQARLGLPP